MPWLVVDGAVAGSWSRRRDGRRATVDVRPLHALGRTAQDAPERERMALVLFLEDG